MSGPARAGLSRQQEIMVVAPPEESFSPEARHWRIPFAIVSTAWRRRHCTAVLESLRVDGIEIDTAAIKFQHGNAGQLPVVEAGRFFPAALLGEWDSLSRASGGGARLPALLQHYCEALFKQITQKVELFPELNQVANELIIPAGRLNFKANRSYRLEAYFRVFPGGEKCGFTLEATAANLQKQAGNWVAGELQLHSTYSDGRRSPVEIRELFRERGYDFVYLTDGLHTGKLPADRWQEYQQELLRASDSRTCLFPGAETAVGSVEQEQGHLLIYGANTGIAGLEEHTRAPQAMLDAVLACDPAAPSSAAIAHPLLGFYPWKNFKVTGHSGMELFSGPAQLLFNLGSGPSRLWREEMARRAGSAASSQPFPSPRAGSDWHGYWFEPLRQYITWVNVEPGWDGLAYSERKAAVDRALYEGRTVISRRGSLGWFTLNNHRIGDIARGIPAGTTLDVQIHYRPAGKGAVDIYLYRDNLAETVFKATATLEAGAIFNRAFTAIFPGGLHFYWLYVQGADHVYSSPIFVSED
ncbi:MAG TPA: hypothetical protein PLY40_03270 [Bacillota bacterium]|nr:hypothetical protein [Bacillota bacterium]